MLNKNHNFDRRENISALVPHNTRHREVVVLAIVGREKVEREDKVWGDREIEIGGGG
jgi:hypothetical protein